MPTHSPTAVASTTWYVPCGIGSAGVGRSQPRTDHGTMTPDISIRNADAKTRLATYLNDHLGGSATGRELAQRTLSRNRGNEYGVALEDVVRQIEEDVATLLELMRPARHQARPGQGGMGWTAEKLGRLKLNGQLLGYSPLSRLIELEGLMLGISGKLALWQALRSVLGDDPRIAGVDLGQLIERAQGAAADGRAPAPPGRRRGPHLAPIPRLRSRRAGAPTGLDSGEPRWRR